MSFRVVVMLAIAAGACMGERTPESDRAADPVTRDAATSNPPATRSTLIRTELLSPDVAVFSGFTNGNVLALRLGEEILLVDAQSDQRVDQLGIALELAGLTEPVGTVVNTHYHTDHVGGNPHFRGLGADVVAHASVPMDMARDTFIVEAGLRLSPEPAEALPTRLVDDTLTWRAAERRVVVRHLPAAHTGGDLAVWVPSLDVLHMGDVVEVGADPFIDWWSGGTLEGMIRAVEWALSIAGPETAIVPGHGPVIDRAELERYLTVLREQVVVCQDGGQGFGCRGDPAGS